jgi:hypothetical protein
MGTGQRAQSVNVKKVDGNMLRIHRAVLPVENGNQDSNGCLTLPLFFFSRVLSLSRLVYDLVYRRMSNVTICISNGARLGWVTLVGGEWSTSRPGCFTPGERAPGTHWRGGWLTSEPVWTIWRREDS